MARVLLSRSWMCFVGLALVGCGFTPQPIQTPPEEPVVQDTEHDPRTLSTATGPPVPSPSQTYPDPSAPTTPVPLGIYGLCWYRPLALKYDPASWLDVVVGEQSGGAYCPNHRLVSTLIEMCTLYEQGPSGTNAEVAPEDVGLGGIQYIVVDFETGPGMRAAWYVEQHSINGYAYDIGSPLLIVEGLSDHWQACRVQAEAVIGTLALP